MVNMIYLKPRASIIHIKGTLEIFLGKKKLQRWSKSMLRYNIISQMLMKICHVSLIVRLTFFSHFIIFNGRVCFIIDGMSWFDSFFSFLME